jgi:hypothetical protein
MKGMPICFATKDAYAGRNLERSDHPHMMLRAITWAVAEEIVVRLEYSVVVQ